MLNGVSKKEKKSLRKKVGDDKLVISLVLIAVGVVLCFFYRDEITSVVTEAVKSLGEKIDAMFNNASGSPTPSGIMLPIRSMLKF